MSTSDTGLQTDGGAIVWITGLPASGKTTLARGLRDALRANDQVTLWLDSDDLRAVLTPRAVYDEGERDRFYGAVAHLARLGADGGATVIVSATAPRRAHRDAARDGPFRFVEIWLRCPLSTARARDPKGLYARSSRGEIKTLPGAGAPYEEPLAADLVLDADRSPDDLVARTLAHLRVLHVVR